MPTLFLLRARRLTHPLLYACASLLLSLLLASSVQAQAPSWQLAVASGLVSAGGGSSVASTATDASGNVYLAGRFAGTVRFGTTTLTSAGSADAFVAKWSTATQQFVWAYRAGGTQYDEATALALSGASVYITGGFEGPLADFGATSLTRAGSTDVFVAKLTDAGPSASFTWAQRAGGTNFEVARGVAVQGTDVYLTGHFVGTASFGARTLTSVGYDLFVTKLTDAGPSSTFIWTQSAGGDANEYGTALVVSGASVYVTGHFVSPQVTFGTTTLVNTGPGPLAFDVFVVKLTDRGASAGFTWAQGGGGSGQDYASALALQGESLYVAGEFSGSAARFGATTLRSAGAGDVFVAKLTDSGPSSAFAWAQAVGGPLGEGATALTVRGPHLYVAGQVGRGPSGADPTAVYVAQLTDAGSSGAVQWTQQAGGTGPDAARALAIAGTRVYVAGAFTGPQARFGEHSLRTDGSGEAGFLAALTEGAVLAQGAPGPLADVALYPNPARHRVLVRVPAGVGLVSGELTLWDATGRLVRRHHYRIAPQGDGYTLTLSGLAPGLYAVSIKAGASQAWRRLIVE
ncbi:T9SS type A sorting domain-containing protein [Hymenobacter sp. HDW8]|uniref:T9SS type A sorting domain-containing protein n=1 Tax=Hymenobacter sp. HDW8 TaxID=2714932 RepID=UPI001407C7AA|nr:T9SS type A sorting domain-containing protein [Hymenobacter sp. HDW8]QIL78369.1 T9SS type A sorting domain-containing protein [Hymenobacter sp. HDW8]